MRSYLLVLRYAVFNLVGVALLAAAWLEGWVAKVVAADITGISLVIAAVFAVGWLLCTVRLVACGRELEAALGNPGEGTRARWYAALVAAAPGPARGPLADCLRSRLYARIASVRTIANALVVLGLIGTVIGFIIALSGIDPAAVADVGAIGPMVSTLIQGMAVALYTTLVGAVFHVWLTVDYHLLAGGTVTLANAIIERIEAPAHFAPAAEAAGV